MCSVVPLFCTQKGKGIFTVTDKGMTRFTITLDEAVDFVLTCTDLAIGGEVFVPKLKSYKIMQLCEVINPNVEVNIIGIRPGEKINECMINETEAENCYECPKFFI